MKDLKFDIYAMTEPKTKEDLMVLLDEAIAEVQHLNEQLDAILSSSWPFPTPPSAP